MVGLVAEQRTPDLETIVEQGFRVRVFGFRAGLGTKALTAARIANTRLAIPIFGSSATLQAFTEFKIMYGLSLSL